MISSPYVRRRRLAAELVALREAAQMTHAELAKRSGVSQSGLSRLETGITRPNPGSVIKVLDVLPNIDAERWEQIVAIAHEAAQRGWWEGEEIDPRQARYADLEAGAATIREYQAPFVPGLLQTSDYARARAELSPPLGGAYDPDALTRARLGRQRMLRRPGGPRYEVIIDEIVIRRPTAPPAVMAEQLRRLAENSDDRVSVRLLPIDAQIEGFAVPQCAFSVYTYRDPGDPVVVAADTVTSDLTNTDPGETEPYVRLYDSLRAAALPEKETSEVFARAAREVEGAL